MPSVAASFELQYDPQSLPTVIWGATAMAGGMYVAGSGDVDARVYRSTNGLNWIETTRPPALGASVSLCCDGSGAVVYFVSTETGTPICKSTNSGSTWTRITNPSAGTINQIFCASNGTDVWIVTSNSELWRSTNSGSSWVKELTASGQLFAVWGVPAGNALWAGGAGGILYTSNGGGTWSSQTSGLSDAIKGIFGISSTEIYAHTGASHATANKLIRSTNGTTWSTITPTGTWKAIQGLWAVSGHLYVSGCNTASGTSKGEVLHSTNQGTAFTTEFSLSEQGDHANGQNIGRIWGYSAGTAEVFCFGAFSSGLDLSATVIDHHVCFRSTLTAGAWKVWTGNFLLTSIWAASASAIWVGGDFGALYKWDGSTWTPMPMALDTNCRSITAMYGFSPTDLYVADSYSQTRSFSNGTINQASVFPSRILHSTDGGVTWAVQYTSNYTINDIWGPDASHVFAAQGNVETTTSPLATAISGSGALLTTNGGGTWTLVPADGPPYGRQAWVTGSSPTDVWTGGANWNGNTNGVHGGDPTASLPFAGFADTFGDFRSAAGMSLGANDVLLGPREGVNYLLRTAGDTAGWHPEIFPTSEQPIVSLAKVSASQLYALTGRKLFFTGESSFVDSRNHGALYCSSGDRAWRDMQLPLGGRSPSRLLVVGSTVYVVGGKWGVGTAGGAGAFLLKFTGPPTFAALTPSPGTTVAYRKWTATAQMAQVRIYPGAIVLASGPRAGKLMVFGGSSYLNSTIHYLSTEFYDRATDTWSAGPDMPAANTDEVVTLADGRLLAMASNGGSTAVVNIYDPVANTWSAGAPTPEPLDYLCNPIVLPSGDVFVIGAHGAAIYTPGTNAWRRISTHPGNAKRPQRVARFTGGPYDGRIAVVSASPGVEVGFFAFEPSTETWTVLTQPSIMTVGTGGGGISSLVALANGRMLATAYPDLGDPAFEGDAQLYDAATDTWTPIGRTLNSAALMDPVVLDEGVVLQQYSDADRTGTRIFDPASCSFRKIAHSPTADFCTGAAQSFAGEVGCAIAKFADGAVWIGAGADIAHDNIVPTPNIYLGCALLAPAVEPSHNSEWFGIAEMHTSRAFYGAGGAVLMADGSVLVAGGYVTTGSETTNLVEKFSPATNQWTQMAPMLDQRGGHGLVVLQNGKVMATGGLNNASPGPSEAFIMARCELYDPGANTWTRTADMATPRKRHRSAVLAAGPNAGKVIVVGGQDTANDYNSAFDTVHEQDWFWGTHTATCEIYNPASNTWASTGSLNTARSRFALVSLAPSGDLLAIGGFNGDNDSGIVPLATIERYSAAAGTWSVVATMSVARERPSAVLRLDGKVVIFGGELTEPITIFNPSGNTLTDVSGPGVYMRECAMALEENGKVVISGGFDPRAFDTDTAPSYSYDPTSVVYVLRTDNTLDTGPAMLTRRAGHILLELNDSRILAIGGGAAGQDDELREVASVETIGCECGTGGGGGGGGGTGLPDTAFIRTAPGADQLGVDIDVLDDVRPSFALCFGFQNVGNAVCRRLSTPAGALAEIGDDPDYGYDLRGRLNSESTLDEIAKISSEVEQEVTKDERIQSAQVTSTYSLANYDLAVDINIQLKTGQTFRLILGVGTVTVDLIDIVAAA